MTKGKLYLIPSPLADCDLHTVLPDSVFEIIRHIGTYVVEEERTVRRFLSLAGLRGHIEELHLTVLNEHTSHEDVEKMIELFDEGNDVGLISEAGLPAVADPGASLVALCHSHGIEVCPMVGPSSLMLALMGSGLNGQSFAFRGYLPAKTDQCRAAIRDAEKLSGTLDQTQIFIETPYRSDSLLKNMLECLHPSTMLCIASNLTSQSQNIVTKSVAQWQKAPVTIGKIPCVFLFLKQYER